MQRYWLKPGNRPGYHVWANGDLHARNKAFDEATRLGTGVAVFPVDLANNSRIGDLLWHEQPSDHWRNKPTQPAHTGSTWWHDSVFE